MLLNALDDVSTRRVVYVGAAERPGVEEVAVKPAEESRTTQRMGVSFPAVPDASLEAQCVLRIGVCALVGAWVAILVLR